MSVLDALDATRICTRWSEPLADPAAWLMSAPAAAPRAQASTQQVGYSWWSLARNPHAMLMSGMVGAVLVKDAVQRILTTS